MLSLLNKLTMYRLVLWGLSLMAAYAFALSALGVLSLGIVPLGASLGILLATCFLAEYALSSYYGSTSGTDSAWITALILFLTLAPPATMAEAALVMIAGALAIVSKYILASNKRHIFNPAALALVILSVSGTGLASWWVGTPLMLPAVAVVGFFVVRKIKRYDVLWAFGAAILGASLATVTAGTNIADTLVSLAWSGPLVFFATIMLTEPITMPPTRSLRILYGLMVGGLYASQFHLGGVYMGPHLALVLGNLYSYAVSSRERIVMRLREVRQLSREVYEFVFTPERRLAYASGQYLEWTLPHERQDSQGNRRYLTIASAPQEQEMRIGVRIGAHPSSFKKALLNMRLGGTILATSLAGDFVLPHDKTHKLLFIAGGVGITPFVSMLRQLMASGERRDIMLMYFVSSKDNLAYQELLSDAQKKLGIRVVGLVNERLSTETLQQYVPDLKERKVYISGPDSMVGAYKTLVERGGASSGNIKTDYFTGL